MWPILRNKKGLESFSDPLYKIKASDLDKIINIVAQSNFVPGYKFICFQAAGNCCVFLFKKKNFLENLFQLK